MTRSIQIVVVAIVGMFVSLLYGGLKAGSYSPNIITALLFQGLVLYGVIKGHKLAWQWGRFASVVGFVGMVAGLVGKLQGGYLVTYSDLPYIMVAIFAAIVYFALGMESSREHFGLVCPSCSSHKVAAENLMFSKAKCKQCKSTW